MSSLPNRKPRRPWRRLGMLTIGVVAIGSLYYTLGHQKNLTQEQLEKIPLTSVTRSSLGSRVTAFGRVESSNSTKIDCKLERLVLISEGRSFQGTGASVILSVLPEGSFVKKDEIICTLDSTEYVEMSRQQDIKVERAEADWLAAKLNLESAMLSVREFEEGLKVQQIQNFDGQIALAESDQGRAEDRLAWSKRMLDKGYVPKSQLSSDKLSLERSRISLKSNRYTRENFLRFGSLKRLMQLKSQVESSRVRLGLEDQRLARFKERRDYYRSMVENCTIKAPHDGYLIYSTEDRNVRIEPGVEVRQGQDLFQLPDLSKMEVVAYMHESVAPKVQAGMMAKAYIEAIGNRMLEGHVTSVAPLPVTQGGRMSNPDLKYFVAVIKLDSVPNGLRPGMTAEVDVQLERANNVLTVPPAAVAFEDGHEFCYVAVENGLVKREVQLGRSTPNALEITGGLNEGETVVVGPEKVDAIEELVIHTPTTEEETPDPVVTVALPTSTPIAATTR